MNEDQKKDELLVRMERSLTNITPDKNQVRRIEAIRKSFKSTAMDVISMTPVSREQSLALIHIEEAVMWAVKSIVLEEGSD